MQHTCTFPAFDAHYRLLARAMRGIGQWSDSIALGYARGFDSGEMMDRIYQNRPSGRNFIGATFDWLYLQQIGCRGLRGRKQLLKQTLRAAIDAQRAQHTSPVIVDVAAGAATYLIEALAEDGGGDVQAIARDLDMHGLRRARARAQLYRLHNVRYERADALDAGSLHALTPQPTIAVASGFYELLLDDALIERSMRAIHDALAPDGTFIFTAQIHHPQLELIAHLLPNHEGKPWVMKNRPILRMHQLARRAGFAHVETKLEKHEIFSVSVARRS